MHIAICDDERKERLHLKSLINEFDSSIKTFLYESAEEMFDGLQTQKCDIILLDIFVDKSEAKELVLTNKIRIPLSRRRKRDFEQSLYKYVREFRYLKTKINACFFNQTLIHSSGIEYICGGTLWS